MPSAWVIETINVFKDGDLDVPARLPRVPPDQFGLERLEETLDCGIIVTISLAAHGRQQLVTAKPLLILVRTILRAAIGVVNAAG